MKYNSSVLYNLALTFCSNCAEHVFFYNNSLGPGAAALLERYARGEFARADERSRFGVTLVQWPVPCRVHIWPQPPAYVEEVHYFAQVPMLTECLTRALRGYEYVAFTDLDEVRFAHTRTRVLYMYSMREIYSTCKLTYTSVHLSYHM